MASANLIAERLTRLLVQDEDEVPAGFYSTEQLSKITGRNAEAIRIGLIGKKCEKILLRVKRGKMIKKMAFYKI